MNQSSIFLTFCMALFSASAVAETCAFPPSSQELSNLPAFKSLAFIDPVKVLDQLTISESNLITAAVKESTAGQAEGLDAVKAWSLFADVPHFYNGGTIQYFGLDKNRYALATFFPDDKQYGVIAKLATQAGSPRELRKAKFTVVAHVHAGEITCVGAQ